VLTLAQFLESCRGAEEALAEGRQDAAPALPALEQCLALLPQARWTELEFAQAGKALMSLRLRAESKIRFFRIRTQMAETLVRAMGGRKAAEPRIDRVF
jgi:hypothetical protein